MPVAHISLSTPKLFWDVGATCLPVKEFRCIWLCGFIHAEKQKFFGVTRRRDLRHSIQHDADSVSTKRFKRMPHIDSTTIDSTTQWNQCVVESNTRRPLAPPFLQNPSSLIRLVYTACPHLYDEYSSFTAMLFSWHISQLPR